MIKKLFQNLSVKAEIEFWLSSQRANLQKFFLFLTVLFLPTQLGLHFWPEFSFIRGIRIDYLSPTLYFTDILIICLILTHINNKSLARFIKFIHPFLKKKEVLVTLSVILLGMLFSKNIPIGLYSLFKIFEYFLLILVIAKNIQKYELRFILPALICGILFESILAIFQFQNQGSLNGLFYFLGERSFSASTPNIANASIAGQLMLRPYGTFSHPNVLSGYLVIGMLIIMLSLKKRLRENLFYYSTCFLGSLALVLTLSRIAIFIWVLFIGFLFLKKIKPILVSLIGLTLMFIIFPQAFLRFTETSLFDKSFLDRVELVKSSIRMIVDHPFFGVGVGNFLNNLTAYYKASQQIIFLQPAHNIFILIVSQIGIIAGGILFYFLYKLFLLTDKKAQYLLLIIVGLGLFDHYLITLQQGQMLFSLVLGIAIAGVIRSNHGTFRNL